MDNRTGFPAVERMYWRFGRATTMTRNRLVAAAKNRPCSDCLGWFEPCQMDFDHRPGTAKLFSIGAHTSHSLEDVVAELRKCDLVCANCHRLRTNKRIYAERIQ